MSAINPSDFLHSLAVFMAAGAGGLAYVSGSPRSLWIWEVREKVTLADGTVVLAGDPYSVLVIYGGPGVTWDPLPRASVQCRTIGTNKAAVAARAEAIYETLFEHDGSGNRQYPLRMKQIAGFFAATPGTNVDGHYRLVSVDPIQPPGSVAPDDRGRADFVFNFDVGFFKEA